MATFGQLIQFGPYYDSGAINTLKLYHYIVGTTTLKDVYTDREKTTTAAQPVESDGNGIVSFFADGIYKFRIDGATDGVTYSTLYTYDKWAVGDQSAAIAGEGADITSASTLTLGTDGNFFHVSGSTGPITAISGLQSEVTLIFDSTPTLTHSANLILQFGVDYTVTQFVTLHLLNEGSGIWRETSRTPISTIPILLDLSGAVAGQIKFPGTQNASSNVNTLDDYEEGTWVPSVGGDTTYTLREGAYTKIGRQVTLHCRIIINVLGTGSATSITGIPFNPQAGSKYNTGAVVWTSSASTLYTCVANLGEGTTTIVLHAITAANATLGSAVSVLGNGASVGFSLSYVI